MDPTYCPPILTPEGEFLEREFLAEAAASPEDLSMMHSLNADPVDGFTSQLFDQAQFDQPFSSSSSLTSSTELTKEQQRRTKHDDSEKKYRSKFNSKFALLEELLDDKALREIPAAGPPVLPGQERVAEGDAGGSESEKTGRAGKQQKKFRADIIFDALDEIVRLRKLVAALEREKQRDSELVQPEPSLLL